MAATPGLSFLQTQPPSEATILFGSGPSAQRPAQPPAGYVYSDTTLNVIVQWTGTTWATFAPTQPYPFGLGNTANQPANPVVPYFYFNTDLGQLIVWTGSIWVTIGPITLPPPPIVPPPQITTQPAPLTVAVSASATFTVAATGAGSLAYQWFVNGVAIGGATSSSYNIASAAQSNAGTYTVTVTGSGGSTSSIGALLIVSGTPYITQQPVSQTIVQGYSVSFSVLATGTAPLTYQWNQNGVPITNATAATYMIGSVQATNAGSYTVTVANGSGTVTSSAATLTVMAAPHKGTWGSFTATGWVTANSDAIFGTFLAGASLGASTLSIQLTCQGGSFPPGVSWSVDSAAGASVVSGTSKGGESSIPVTVSVPTAVDQPSYTILLSYTSLLQVSAILSLSGGSAVFINSSVRSKIAGPVIYPPGGTPISLQSSTLATGSIVNIGFQEVTNGTSGVYYGAPYSWNFNGLTPNPANPLQGYAPGGNSITLTGYSSPGGFNADSVLSFSSA